MKVVTGSTVVVMRETITVQVGQCGNQIGSLFWQLLLLEHEKTPDTDAALSAYFRFAPAGIILFQWKIIYRI